MRGGKLQIRSSSLQQSKPFHALQVLLWCLHLRCFFLEACRIANNNARILRQRSWFLLLEKKKSRCLNVPKYIVLRYPVLPACRPLSYQWHGFQNIRKVHSVAHCTTLDSNYDGENDTADDDGSTHYMPSLSLALMRSTCSWIRKMDSSAASKNAVAIRKNEEKFVKMDIKMVKRWWGIAHRKSTHNAAAVCPAPLPPRHVSPPVITLRTRSRVTSKDKAQCQKEKEETDKRKKRKKGR